jgi:hypothetical protein
VTLRPVSRRCPARQFETTLAWRAGELWEATCGLHGHLQRPAAGDSHWQLAVYQTIIRIAVDAVCSCAEARPDWISFTVACTSR